VCKRASLWHRGRALNTGTISLFFTPHPHVFFGGCLFLF
jgi:hypothetical protein